MFFLGTKQAPRLTRSNSLSPLWKRISRTLRPCQNGNVSAVRLVESNHCDRLRSQSLMGLAYMRRTIGVLSGFVPLDLRRRTRAAEKRQIISYDSRGGLPASARPTRLKNFSSSKGLVRNPNAPACITFAAVAGSSWPVIKMTRVCGDFEQR